MDLPATRSLLERLADGHQSPAWTEFVRLYTPLFQYWIRPHLLQSADVDDVVQDVLVVVLAKLPGFEPVGPGAFRAWLRAILAYRLQTHRRRLRGRLAGGFDSLMAGLADSSSPLARAWDEEHDRHVIGGLLDVVRPSFKPNTWQAFWRTSILEESPAKVAADLGLTPNAVFIARSRVMRRLRAEATGLVDDT